MKRKLIPLLLLILILVGCQAKSPANYLVISMQDYAVKMDAEDSFVLYIGSDTCPACKEHKANAFAYLKTHSNHNLFAMDIKQINSDSRLVFATTAYELIGSSFYTAHGLQTNLLYIPTTIRYQFGIAVQAKIGVIEKEDFSFWFTE